MLVIPGGIQTKTALICQKESWSSVVVEINCCYRENSLLSLFFSTCKEKVIILQPGNDFAWKNKKQKNNPNSYLIGQADRSKWQNNINKFWCILRGKNLLFLWQHKLFSLKIRINIFWKFLHTKILLDYLYKWLKTMREYNINVHTLSDAPHHVV